MFWDSGGTKCGVFHGKRLVLKGQAKKRGSRFLWVVRVFCKRVLRCISLWGAAFSGGLEWNSQELGVGCEDKS